MAEPNPNDSGESSGASNADAIGVAAVAGAIDGGGSDFGDHIVIDPTKIGTAAGSGQGNNGEDQPRRRGRPRGSRNGAKANKSPPLDLDGVAFTLYSLHMMGAAILSAPRLELKEDESKHLAKGIMNVQRHYTNVVFTEKQMDWVNLFGVIGAVYGKRFMDARADRAAARAAKKAAGPQPGNGAMPDGIMPGTFSPGMGFTTGPEPGLQ